jgi:hypothetical protein
VGGGELGPDIRQFADAIDTWITLLDVKPPVDILTEHCIPIQEQVAVYEGIDVLAMLCIA